VKPNAALLWLLPALLGLACGHAGPPAELAADMARRGSADRADDALALGQALQSAHLDAASIEPLRRAATGSAATRAAATEALLEAQARLDDPFLVPAFLAAHPEAHAVTGPVEARAELLRGLEAQRAGQLTEAEKHLRRIPFGSSLDARARYALGVVLADPDRPGGPRIQEALDSFQAVVGFQSGQEQLEEMRALAQLAIGRVLYARRADVESARAYDAVPRGARVWPQALFERGYPRFRSGDDGGALGTLQATRAPQLSTAYLPEARILEATVLFRACLYDDMRAVLDDFTAEARPLLERVRPVVTERPMPRIEAEWVLTDAGRPLLGDRLWRSLRSEPRIGSGMALLRRIEAERGQLSRPEMGASSERTLRELEGVRAEVERALAETVHGRLGQVTTSLRDLLEQADVLRFETTKGEKELLEAGIDQSRLLASRPAPPVPQGRPDEERWRVDGEWWWDEIGNARATLKNGCAQRPAQTNVH
jgi:hypothetical protein